MKTMLCLGLLMASFGIAQAHDANCACGCGPANYQAAIPYATPVVYQMPVVYQAPVVYQVPVIYLAPVYYVASAAAAYCPAPSTVVHIGGGRGTYSYSTCDNYYYPASTVIHIGGGRSFSHGNRFLNYNSFHRW